MYVGLIVLVFTHMRDKKFVSEDQKGRDHLGRPMCLQKDNIKTDLNKYGIWVWARFA
jgi:hypothetical protein